MKVLVSAILGMLISSTALGEDIKTCTRMIADSVRQVEIDGQHISSIKVLSGNILTANIHDRGKSSHLVVRETGSVAIPLDGDLTCQTGSKFGNRKQFIARVLEAYVKAQIDYVIRNSEYRDHGQAHSGAIKGFDWNKESVTSACGGISPEIDLIFESYEIPETTRYGVAR